MSIRLHNHNRNRIKKFRFELDLGVKSVFYSISREKQC